MNVVQQKIRFLGIIWLICIMGAFGAHNVNFEITTDVIYFNLTFFISTIIIWLLRNLSVIHTAVAIIWTLCFIKFTFLIYPFSPVSDLILIGAMKILGLYVIWECFTAIVQKKCNKTIKTSEN